ncbi:MAG: MaoC/PaaZ C-terminal domain-containing protein [Gammaproteobacteria bacterium]
MTLDASLVGYTTRWFEHRLDTRWSMAYAAALGEVHACYFDDRAGRPLAVHPLFPVCLEWPALVDSLAANGVDMRRTVHATHDLELLAPLTPPQDLRSRATVIGVEQRAPGIYLGWRFETIAADGRLLARTWQGNLFLGAQLRGPPRWDAPLPQRPAAALATPPSRTLRLPAGLAHTYTECARIWNPLHTEAAVAAAAGMPRPPLHGTATLAVAVSALVADRLGGDAGRVRRLGGRFNALVLLPCELALACSDDVAARRLHFEVRNADGGRAVRDGFLDYA